MSKTTPDLWTRLSVFPGEFKDYTILFQTESLIAIPFLFWYGCDKYDIIYKYSFSKDTWMEYPIKMKNHGVINLGVAHKSKIYLCTNNSKIVIMELINGTNKYKEIKKLNKPPETHNLGEPVIVDDDFHYIADKHIKYNSKTKISEIVPNAPMRKHTTMRNVIQVKDKLILFESSMLHPNIHEYDIKTNCWRCLSISVPFALWPICCTPILYGQIILIINATRNTRNIIYIYELKKQIITESKVQLSKDDNQIFSMNDQKKDILITDGWIRNTVEVLNIYLPVYLIQIIENYYINEDLLVMNRLGNLFKIDVFEILNSY